MEGRILDLDDKIGRAEIIDVSKLSGTTVLFGATIVVIDENTEEEMTYQIVGDEESDIKKGFLSISSPLARALIGKKMGESVEVNTPKGLKNYEITKVVFR